MLFLLLLQTVPAPAASTPDIQLRAHVTVKSLTIEKQGEASLKVWSTPDAGSAVEVEAPRANGRKTIKNVTADVDAKAVIAAPNGG